MRSASATRRLISESVSLPLALSSSLSMYLFSLCLSEMGQVLWLLPQSASAGHKTQAALCLWQPSFFMYD